MKRSLLVILAVGFVVLAASNVAKADSFTLTGTGSFSGQGFGTIYTILSLHHNGTETGAVAPANASNLASFGTCSGSPTALCGNATNQSEVITAANLATLGITGASTFGLLYNVNQEGGDPNSYLYPSNPFTVYFYDSSGNVLFSASFAGTSDPFPPFNGNGQGSSGYLFALTCTTAECFNDFPQIANIGMSGTIGNANAGADGWSVVNPGGANPVPEPGTLTLLGTGLLALGGLIRRHKKS